MTEKICPLCQQPIRRGRKRQAKPRKANGDDWHHPVLSRRQLDSLAKYSGPSYNARMTTASLNAALAQADKLAKGSTVRFRSMIHGELFSKFEYGDWGEISFEEAKALAKNSGC